MDPHADHAETAEKPPAKPATMRKRTKDPRPLLASIQSNARQNQRINHHLNNAKTEQNQTHSFITDVADVRQMEQGLLKLLDDFNSGRLQAFGQDITFEKMESVREQQEKLARLHFDLNSQQELFRHDSEEQRQTAKENMSKLIDSLQQLSFSIEQLQSRSTGIGPKFE